VRREQGHDLEGDQDREALGNPSRGRLVVDDNAELARYLDANGHRFRSETVEADRAETGAEISPAMTAPVAELNRVIVDLRADRDAWREQAQRLTLPARKPDEKPAEKPMTWWRWRATS
jgi:hypothetical protein